MKKKRSCKKSYSVAVMSGRGVQQRTNPVEKNRHPTDKFFISIFFLILVVWLVINILGFFFHPSTDDNDDFVQIKHLIRTITSVVNTSVTSLSTTLIIAAITVTVIFMLYTLLIWKFTKFFITIGLYFHLLKTLSMISALTKFQIVEKITTTVVLQIVAIACILSVRVISTIAFLAASTNESIVDEASNIVKNSCRSILKSPTLILFTILISILVYSVIFFIMNSMQANLLSDKSVALVASFLTVNTIGSLFVLIFILSFALMVISEYTINYYWNDDGKPQIGKSMVQILRNHAGTIVLSSTVIIPYSCAMFQFLKHKRSEENNENVILYIITKIFLTLTMPIDALIFSSIYGSSFVKSSQKTFDEILRHCSLFLYTIGALEGLYDVVGVMYMIRVIVMVHSKSNEHWLVFLVYGVSSPILFFVYLMHASTKALLVNDIILNKEN